MMQIVICHITGCSLCLIISNSGYCHVDFVIPDHLHLFVLVRNITHKYSRTFSSSGKLDRYQKFKSINQVSEKLNNKAQDSCCWHSCRWTLGKWKNSKKDYIYQIVLTGHMRWGKWKLRVTLNCHCNEYQIQVRRGGSFERLGRDFVVFEKMEQEVIFKWPLGFRLNQAIEIQSLSSGDLLVCALLLWGNRFVR